MGLSIPGRNVKYWVSALEEVLVLECKGLTAHRHTHTHAHTASPPLCGASTRFVLCSHTIVLTVQTTDLANGFLLNTAGRLNRPPSMHVCVCVSKVSLWCNTTVKN